MLLFYRHASVLNMETVNNYRIIVTQCLADVRTQLDFLSFLLKLAKKLC